MVIYFKIGISPFYARPKPICWNWLGTFIETSKGWNCLIYGGFAGLSLLRAQLPYGPQPTAEYMDANEGDFTAVRNYIENQSKVI